MRLQVAIVFAIGLVTSSLTHADELQDRIRAAVQAYADTTPNHPDLGIGWAQMYVDDAVKLSNPAGVIQTTAIGDWLAKNQPVDTEPAKRAARVATLAATFKHIMKVNAIFDTPLPAQSISVAELQGRVLAAVDDVLPGPTRAELAAQEAEAAQQTKEAAEEMQSRRFPQ